MDKKKPLTPLVIEGSTDSFQTWLHRPYLSSNLRDRLKKANVLLVPNEGYAKNAGLIYFPVRTDELFQFLRDTDHRNLSVEICIEDEDYQELALHGDLLMIASMVVDKLIAPLIVALLAKYIMRRLGTREKHTDVKSKVTIVDKTTRRSVGVSYQGPAASYKEVMIKAVTKLSGQQYSVLTKNSKSKTSKGSKAQKLKQ